jgi:hypothetical protein
MIRFFQGYEKAIEIPNGRVKSCKRTWEESTPNNLHEALGVTWRKTDTTSTWIEVDGLLFEGGLFPEPVTKEDREAYDRLVLLLLRLAVNPRQGRETLSLFRQLELCFKESGTGFLI